MRRSDASSPASHAPRLLGCIPAANRFACCCPLQQGIYIIAILSTACGFAWLLHLLGDVSIPWLTTDYDGPLMTLPALVDDLRSLFSTIMAFLVGYHAWRAASALSLGAVRHAIHCVWVWLGITLVGVSVHAFCVYFVMKDLTPLIPSIELTLHFARVIFLVMAVNTSFALMTVYYLTSLKVRLKRSERSLVLLGVENAPLGHFMFGTGVSSTMGRSRRWISRSPSRADSPALEPLLSRNAFDDFSDHSSIMVTKDQYKSYTEV